MAEEKKYIAVQRIEHSVNGKSYEPGSIVPLDHLDEANVQILLDMNAVKVGTPAEITKAKRAEKETAKA